MIFEINVDGHHPSKNNNTVKAGAMLFLLIGIILLAAGLLFVGQGWGYVRWPARSFMIDETKWIYYGAGIALAGLVLIIVSRR